MAVAPRPADIFRRAADEGKRRLDQSLLELFATRPLDCLLAEKHVPLAANPNVRLAKRSARDTGAQLDYAQNVVERTFRGWEPRVLAGDDDGNGVEVIRELLGDGGAAEDTGKNADQGDPDLHRRKKVVGIPPRAPARHAPGDRRVDMSLNSRHLHARPGAILALHSGVSKITRR